jgi:hypothetical protein
MHVLITGIAAKYDYLRMEIKWNQNVAFGIQWVENQRTWIKPLEARERTNNQLNSHMTLSQEIKPGSQEWWEASTFTATTPMSPIAENLLKYYIYITSIDNGLLAFLRRNSFYLVPG